jgi:hypothetical protein
MLFIFRDCFKGCVWLLIIEALLMFEEILGDEVVERRLADWQYCSVD